MSATHPKNRNGLHSAKKNHENHLKMWGNGETELATQKKRRNNINRMNNGGYVSRTIIEKYGITQSDVKNVSSVLPEVLIYLQETTLSQNEVKCE